MHYHHIVCVAERGAGGEITGALAIGRDTTERKHAEEALARSEYSYRTLAENLPDNIIRYDRDCRVRYMNPAMARTIAPELLPKVGKQPYESDPDSEQILGLQRLVEQVMDSGERVEVEFEILHPDGTPHWHHVIFVPERDENGEVVGALGIGRDISERVRADEALKRSLADYSGLVQRIPVGVYKYRMPAQGSIVFDYVSPRWCELLDVTEAEVMRDHGAAFARIHLDELERFARLNDEARRNLRRFEWEGRVVRKNGEVRWLHIESQPTQLENGDILWDGIQYDVTDRRKAEEALRITASVFDSSREAIVITDADNDIIDVNPAFSRITGYSRDEVLGRNPRLLSSGRQDKAFYQTMWATLKQDRAWRGEIWNRRKSGEIYAELLSVSAICDDAGRVQRYVGVFSDITYFKDHEAELSHVANYDALTGVPNRRLLGDRMGQAILHAQRNGSMLAVCYIDLDGFKSVNDQYGHETGDLLLVAITRRLQEVLRAGDTLARLGGDEFVVLFNDLAQEVECLQVLERMVQTIALPIQIDGHQLTVSASIGVTFYPSDEEDGDTLLRHADQAMYAAKQSGKNRYHLYDPVHDQRVRSMHESRRRILQGLRAGEFELYYQPLLEFATGDIVGVEALIRWHHPERGLLLPGKFLPDVENSELEVRLGNWVMD
ncbi:MAG: diguanylate cyclase, partial [Pseudomonadota bacterium]